MLSWRPRNCSFRPRRNPPQPLVRPGFWSGVGMRAGGGSRGSAASNCGVLADLRATAPCGPGPLGRPGRVEQPPQPRGVSRRRPDAAAAGGRAEGRGGLRECPRARPRHPTSLPCALRPHVGPRDLRWVCRAPNRSTRDSLPLGVPRSATWSGAGRLAGEVGGGLGPSTLSLTSCPHLSWSWCGQVSRGSPSGHPGGAPKHGER